MSGFCFVATNAHKENQPHGNNSVWQRDRCQCQAALFRFARHPHHVQGPELPFSSPFLVESFFSFWSPERITPGLHTTLQLWSAKGSMLHCWIPMPAAPWCQYMFFVFLNDCQSLQMRYSDMGLKEGVEDDRALPLAAVMDYIDEKRPDVSWASVPRCPKGSYFGFVFTSSLSCCLSNTRLLSWRTWLPLEHRRNSKKCTTPWWRGF